MASSQPEELEDFLRRQPADSLVGVLLELAADNEAVQQRLARMQLADRPDKLAAAFRKQLTAWRRSTKYRSYRETREYARALDGWLDQVTRELLPRDLQRALELFETFIESDARWFESADDSDGLIGDVVRKACWHWLEAGARGDPSRDVRLERLLRLLQHDDYGAREELLRRADLLLDEQGLRELAGRYEDRLAQLMTVAARTGELPTEVFQVSGSLSLLSAALRDPDLKVRSVLRYSPKPNELQKESFVQAYLEADRPGDALQWLEDSWGHKEGSRQHLLADALERLGRFEESAPIRRQLFERSLSATDLARWLEHLPAQEHAAAHGHARELAQSHDDPVAAATLLLELGDPPGAESVLLSAPELVDGRDYYRLPALATSLGAHGCSRGATVLYRALLEDILDRAYARAYGHAARYWHRLCEIAGSDIALAPLQPHSEFAAEVHRRHGRKVAFWSRLGS